jgi:large subunit ribosomal protein L31
VKTEGHPVLNNVCFLDIGTGKKFLTKSTMKSARTEKIDGKDYFVVVRDVTMDSHPAYTGEKRLVDTAGRVEKFTTKFKRGTAKAK